MATESAQNTSTVATSAFPATDRVIVTTSDSIQVIDPSSLLVSFYGYQINLATVLIVLIISILLMFLWKIQRSSKLDFADMITADGKKVSLTKFLQLMGGLASTWFVLRLGLDNKLSESMFAIYLTYIASVEGFAKFMAAKYGYSEVSVAEAGTKTHASDELEAAVKNAADAEKSARVAKTSARSAANELN